MPEKKREIAITITGDAGAGKTPIANLLYDRLKNAFNNLNVTLYGAKSSSVEMDMSQEMNVEIHVVDTFRPGYQPEYVPAWELHEGDEVTAEIPSGAVGRFIKHVSSNFLASGVYASATSDQQIQNKVHPLTMTVCAPGIDRLEKAVLYYHGRILDVERKNNAAKPSSAPGQLRDLEADLVICNAASEEPWELTGDDSKPIVCGSPTSTGYRHPVLESVSWEEGGHGARTASRIDVDETDLRFFKESRAGWPHAIQRALVAEHKLALEAAKADLAQRTPSDELKRVKAANLVLQTTLRDLLDAVEEPGRCLCYAQRQARKDLGISPIECQCLHPTCKFRGCLCDTAAREKSALRKRIHGELVSSMVRDRVVSPHTADLCANSVMSLIETFMNEARKEQRNG